jgi:hypothetical protein
MSTPRDPRRPPDARPERLRLDEDLDLGLTSDNSDQPIPLELDALEELPMDALFAPDEEGTDPGLAILQGEPEPLDLSALDIIEEEAIPLIEGFEVTAIEERAPRRRKPGDPSVARRPAVAEFVFTACPSCQTEQPDPAPPFCETCGQRLRKPGKRGARDAISKTKRCGECGIGNYEEDSVCTNCGSRLPS